MVVVDAPGPAEFIETVIPLLQKKSELLIVTVNTKANAAYNVLRKFKPLRCDRVEDAEKIYKDFDPDILAVAMSSLVLGPYVNNRFTELAHKDKKKVIAFQDFWANHRWPMNYKVVEYFDEILAPDKLAKKFLLEDGYKGKISITGNPNFDRFKKLNKAKERKWLRNKFGLSENDFVILYVGRGTPQSWEHDEITFKFFAEGVRELMADKSRREVGTPTSISRNLNSASGNILVAIRPHPRDENPERYGKFSQGLKLLDTLQFPSSEDLLPIFDLIAGIQSANHVEACYLRIPAVCILLPNAGQITMEKLSLSDFPPNIIGANIGVYRDDIEEFVHILKKMAGDKKFVSAIEKAQKKYFPLPKTLAAKKVAEALLL